MNIRGQWLRGRARAGRSLWTATAGATAVEFALIAPLLVMFLVGTLEMAIYLYTTTVVDGALAEGARKIRTGQAQNSANPLTTFQTEVCSELGPVYDCNQITYDVRTFSSFNTVTTPLLHYDENGVLVDENDVPYVPVFTPGNPGDITVVRAIYRVKFYTPGIATLVGDKGSGKYVSSTVVFRNEPYD